MVLSQNDCRTLILLIETGKRGGRPLPEGIMNVILGTGCKSQSETIETSFQFPGGSDSKESACNEGDPSSIQCQEDPLEKGIAIHVSIFFFFFTFFKFIF